MDSKCCGNCKHGSVMELHKIRCGIAYATCVKMLGAVGVIPASVAAPGWKNMKPTEGADCFCFTPKGATDGHDDKANH